MTLPGPSADVAESRAAAPPVDCFHCGLPVPVDLDLQVEIGGVARPMCCPGCQAVAEAIVAAGQENFYRSASSCANWMRRRAKPA